MKFDLKTERNKFKFYVDKLIGIDCIVELTRIRKPRTIQQNKYLHVLIALLAIETGYTLDEMKTVLKRKCDFMKYRKSTGFEKVEIFLKKSSSLDTKGLTDWINWIRDYAGTAGFFLPSAEDYHRNWTEIEREIEQHKTYL